MAREKKIRLDCTALTRGSYRGSRMFARLRYYYGSKSARFNRRMSDPDVLAYAYARHSQVSTDNPLTAARVRRDYQAWLDGGIAPDYACSELRNALKDPDHRLVSVAHLDRYMLPLAA